MAKLFFQHIFGKKETERDANKRIGQVEIVFKFNVEVRGKQTLNKMYGNFEQYCGQSGNCPYNGSKQNNKISVVYVSFTPEEQLKEMLFCFQCFALLLSNVKYCNFNVL